MKFSKNFLKQDELLLSLSNEKQGKINHLIQHSPRALVSPELKPRCKCKFSWTLALKKKKQSDKLNFSKKGPTAIFLEFFNSWSKSKAKAISQLFIPLHWCMIDIEYSRPVLTIACLYAYPFSLLTVCSLELVTQIGEICRHASRLREKYESITWVLLLVALCIEFCKFAQLQCKQTRIYRSTPFEESTNAVFLW